MKKISVSELRTHLQESLDTVHYTKTPLLVSKNGKPWAMIQSLPEDDKDLQRMLKEKH